MNTQTNRPLTDNQPNACRIIAWEVTRRCNLHCAHCRGSAKNESYENELSNSEAITLIDEMAALGKPLIIFTGGDPLLREDIFELASYAKEQKLRCVMSVNGTLLTAKTAQKMQLAGISRCSISIDAGDAQTHDLFRGQKGAFDAALEGMGHLKEAGVPFQINTTVSGHNIHALRPILNFCKREEARAWHVFMLIHTGRASGLAPINPADYEKTLLWLARAAREESMEIRPTCAPQYQPLCLNSGFTSPNQQQNGMPCSAGTGGKWDKLGKSGGTGKIGGTGERARPVVRGCMAGAGFCFISHTGMVQPCGYLETPCGDVRNESLKSIWAHSPVFESLRERINYSPHCAGCSHFNLCSGCRARALWHSGNMMGDDPLCTLFKP